ncbi:MAG: chloride channel protein [Rhodospirillales bacterium]|nr:chloride channel protein [Rhodospirillales bacterium]
MALLAQLRRLKRRPMFSPRQWKRRVAFLFGAVLVAVIAILFAHAGTWAGNVFNTLTKGRPWMFFILCPGGLGVSVWLTQRFFQGAQGSGIPQAIAALHMEPEHQNRVMSARVAVAKVGLCILGLVCGASIGREGPTVQIGAATMHGLGRVLKLPRADVRQALILAGGAAGIAGAFNTPIAGVVFAIEELGHSVHLRSLGAPLYAVVLGGIATVGIAGNYTYFGTTDAALGWGIGWVAVLIAGVLGGLAGGLFARLLVDGARLWPAPIRRLAVRSPVAFAVLCGLVLALVGLATNGSALGSGYDPAKAMVEQTAGMPSSALLFTIAKFIATTASYLSGMPGGIFAPSLAVGSGLGAALAPLVPAASAGALVLLGMVAYFSGVVQAPLTATVIVMEMTNNQGLTVPLMATALIAMQASRLVCRKPLYGVLAKRFH